LAPVLSSAQQWLPIITVLAEDPLAKVGAVDAFQGYAGYQFPILIAGLSAPQCARITQVRKESDLIAAGGSRRPSWNVS